MKVECLEELSHEKNAFTVGQKYELIEDEEGVYLSINHLLVKNNHGETAAYPMSIFKIIEGE